MAREVAVETSEDRRAPASSLPLQRAVLGYFLLLLAFVPVTQLAVELSGGRPLQELDVFRRWPTTDRISAYERALEKNSAVAEFVRRRLQWVGLVALRAGNQKAVVGAGWTLFYRPGLDSALRPGFMGSPDAEGHPVAAIVAFRDALAARGSALMLLVAPGKEAVYPEWLWPGYEQAGGPAVNPDMESFTREMAARGIAVIDPTALLWSHKADGDLYLRHDTHWTPEGLALVADKVARHVPADLHGDAEMALEQSPQSAPGDLLDMLQLPAWSTPLRRQTVVARRVVDAASGAPVEFDKASPVVLLGDSFTNIYSLPEMGWGAHAGLGEQLAYRLRRPVDVVALNDGGVNTARATLARRPEPLAGKRLVIWQFAARDLVVSNGRWQRIAVGR